MSIHEKMTIKIAEIANLSGSVQSKVDWMKEDLRERRFGKDEIYSIHSQASSLANQAKELAKLAAKLSREAGAAWGEMDFADEQADRSQMEMA